VSIDSDLNAVSKVVQQARDVEGWILGAYHTFTNAETLVNTDAQRVLAYIKNLEAKVVTLAHALATRL
jgi:hypothetical protein